MYSKNVHLFNYGCNVNWLFPPYLASLSGPELYIYGKNQGLLVQRLFLNEFPRLQKKPVDFDGELKIGDVWYDNMTKITIKVQLFWHLPYKM